MHTELYSLLLITFLAVMVPILASRMRIVRLPIVVGEILAGMVIGQSGFNLVTHTPALDFLAEFGFVFLMFLSGLELNMEELTEIYETNGDRSWWRGPFALVGYNFVLTLVLAGLIGLILVRWGLARNPVLMGLILSTTSLGIVVPVLKERGMTDTTYGQILLMGALVSDFVTLLLLSLSLALVSHGPSMELLFILFLLAAFALSVRLGQWAKKVRFLSRTLEELSHATAQIRVRGAFALMVAWIFVSRHLGIEVILGAFLAGAFISLISGDRDAHHLRSKLEAIGYGFFIPIFFISVGAKFNLGILLQKPETLLLVPVIILASYLVKILPALVFRSLFSWREALAGGILLSSRLSLIIAAAAIAMDLEMITQATNSAIILVAVVTCTLSPIIFTKIIHIPTLDEREGIIVLGTGPLAVFIGQRLLKAGERVTFLGLDSHQLTRLFKQGFKVALGRPDDETILSQAGAATAEALIAIDDDAELGLAVCRKAKGIFDIPNLVALADQPDLVSSLKHVGVHVVQRTMATALAVEGALHYPMAFEMLADLDSGMDLTDTVVMNKNLAGRQLRNVRLPGGVLVMGLKREGEALVPNGATALEPGDILTLIGHQAALKEAKKIIQGKAGI